MRRSAARPIRSASRGSERSTQPSGLPRTRPKTSRNSAAENSAAPAQSTGSGSGARDSASFVSVSAIAATPIGTLTKKIDSQPNASVSRPPISGPIATAPPTVAPQMPNAVARSGPWNSCAISASVVANIAAPPTPCSAAHQVQERRVAGEPAEQRGEREDREAGGEDAAPPEAIAERAGRQKQRASDSA